MKINTKNNREIISPPKFDKIHKKIQREKQVENTKRKSSTFYLLWFIVFVAFFIGMAVLVRVIFLYQKSTFNSNSYSVLIKDENPYVLAYEKVVPKLTFISIPNYTGNKLEQSLRYALPIDSEIKTETKTSLQKIFSPSQLFGVLFKSWIFNYKDMTVIDHLKLIFNLLSFPEDRIKSYEVKINNDGEIQGMSQEEIYDAFKDSNIIDEGLSISVVNSTRESGLAGRVALILRSLGGNIVSVSSSESSKKSYLSSAKDSSTLRRISVLLGITPIIKAGNNISDINIILGEDFKEKSK